jgi:hypothetical protein
MLYYVDVRFTLLQAEVDRRFVTELRALDAAAVAMDRRLGGMSEFQAQLTDVIARLESREYADARRAELLGRVEKLEAGQSASRARYSIAATVAAVAAVLITGFGFAIEHFTR